jgi:hypothetical protein
MRKNTVVSGALVTAGLLAGMGQASADEVKSPINATLLLKHVLTRPVDDRQLAFDESLKREGPAPRPASGEVQPDGSVRYGNVTVTVKNPCPPGTDHYEPPPLPGRRARK